MYEDVFTFFIIMKSAASCNSPTVSCVNVNVKEYRCM